MLDFLESHPLVLLFVVISFGYFIGNIKIKGNGLGVAAVLFTGLAFGALDSRFEIPDIVFQLGLSVFVYSVGLSSGPVFFKAYKENGLKDFIFAMTMLIFTGLIACGLWYMFGFSASTITGVYTGSTTNTAALAGLIEYLKQSNISEAAFSTLEKEAIIGYTFSYPMGVLGGIIAIVLMEKILKIDYAKELESLKSKFPLSDKLTSRSLKVTNPQVFGENIRDLKNKYGFNVSFGRAFQGKRMHLVTWNTVLEEGDGLIAVGESAELDKLQTPDTVLELGDRIRFIARREDLAKLSAFFGDSYQQVSRVNLFSFGLGIGLGLIIGSIPIPLGSGAVFKLGFAGGPLLVGLVLGATRRTGKIVWTMPFGSAITLQQIGLMLLLASIGISSGFAFRESLGFDKIWVFLAGTIMSLLTAVVIFLVGYKIRKMPFSLLTGMVANQPAILDFAMERTGNRIPMFGFSQIFPIALIMKIVIAQVLYIFLSTP